MKFADGSEIVMPRPLVSQEERVMLLEKRVYDRRQEEISVEIDRRVTQRREQ